MSPSPQAGSAAEIATRLRSAGCVFAEDEARLLIDAARTSAALAEMVARRAGGLPLEHILGWAAFSGMRVEVDHGVFVPRRRTELLVAEAVAVTRPGWVVVDLCCGSGAVGVALAAAVEPIELHAVDIDATAVRCATRNGAAVGAQVHEGDLYEPLPVALRGRVDVLVVNAPYVPADELALMPAEARIHEPRSALDGGRDGLDVQRRVVAEARRWLTPAGHLLVETSARQSEQTCAIFARAGLTADVVRSRDLDATVVVGIPRPVA